MEVQTEKKSLVAIAHDMVALEQKIIERDGELDAGLEKELAEISTQLSTKVDAYKWRMDRLEAAIEFWKNQKDEAAQAESVLKNFLKGMQNRIKETMVAMEVTEVRGQKFVFGLSAGKPKLVIDKEEDIPDNFFIVKTEHVPDNEKIKEALLKDASIPGVHLEPVWTLRKKANKDV